MGEVVRFAMAHGRSHIFTAVDGRDLWIFEPASACDLDRGWEIHEFSRSGDSGVYRGAPLTWSAALAYVRWVQREA